MSRSLGFRGKENSPKSAYMFIGGNDMLEQCKGIALNNGLEANPDVANVGYSYDAITIEAVIAKNPNISHGGLEIVFTRDEETNMTGINHVKFEELDSELWVKIGKNPMVYVVNQSIDIDEPSDFESIEKILEARNN